METLQLLGVALGMATLAGINLYLTVFVTGLVIQQHWIVLTPAYTQLQILGNPVIVAVAGVLYFVEFFADKVPWVDSLWDSLHTVIRPIGAALIAVRVLGEPNPIFDVLIALVGGGAALLTHSVKAGTRLVANTSPEPFSNVALSVGEDVVVLAGLSLINWDPLVALAVFGLLLSTIIYYLPKLYRASKVILWLIWKKLCAPARDADPVVLSKELSSDADMLLSRINPLNEKVEWAVPCLSGSAPKLPRNVFGYLVAMESKQLHFVARNGKLSQTFDLTGFKVTHEPKFLSENMVLYRESGGRDAKSTFVFDRGMRPIVKAAVEALRSKTAEQPTEQPEPL